MEKVPLKELKQNLAHYAELAAGGKIIEVTKHNRSYIQLMPSQNPSIQKGFLFGKKSLEPALKTSRKGSVALKSLLEDREERF